MSFLLGKVRTPGQEIDCLYEAQVSVLIAAINQDVWTGYCFVDTYHELEGRRQTVEDYCNNELDPDQVRLDPFNQDESENPLLDPGEYFLTSLDYQMKVFKREWQETQRMFRKRVRAYVRTPKLGLNLSQL
jgi:hypothetical protein